MSTGGRAEKEGILSRSTAAVYGVLAIAVCFVVACLPYVAAVLVLPNPIAIAIAGSTIGPAWVAAIGTSGDWLRSRDLEPVRRYAHHWRQGARQALLFWTPFWILLLVLGADLSVGGPGVATVGLWVLGAIALLWGSTVLLLVAHFAFRLRDVLRLAVWGLVRSPRWLVADAAILLVVGAAVLTGGELLAGLLAAPVALVTELNARPLVAKVRASFTAEGRAEQQGAGA